VVPGVDRGRYVVAAVALVSGVGLREASPLAAPLVMCLYAGLPFGGGFLIVAGAAGGLHRVGVGSVSAGNT
jgi:hypothetical protein